MNLFTLYHFELSSVTGSIFCSVVPALDAVIEKALVRPFGRQPMIVGPSVKTGLNVHVTLERQVGADIITDAMGHCDLVGKNL